MTFDDIIVCEPVISSKSLRDLLGLSRHTIKYAARKYQWVAVESGSGIYYADDGKDGQTPRLYAQMALKRKAMLPAHNGRGVRLFGSGKMLK